MFPRLVCCQALTCAEVASHWWVRPHQKAVDFKAPGVPGLLLAQGGWNWILGCVVVGLMVPSLVLTYWWVVPYPDTADFVVWGVLKLMLAHW